MTVNIGGEFEIGLSNLSHPASKWREEKNSIYTDTGRAAIYLALQSVLANGGKRKAWLPRYACPSVVMPFLQLGFQVDFYSMGKNLQNPVDLPSHMRNETFLYIHYFGKKNEKVIKWINSQGIRDNNFIIEDCVQASINENVGKDGDFSIRSFRKFLPQPDGAILKYKLPFSYELGETSESFISQKIIGKLLRYGNVRENEYLAFFSESERVLDEQVIIPKKYSWMSKILYCKSDLPLIRKRRRENWLYVQSEIEKIHLDSEGVRSLYEDLSEGEVPLGYPILLPEKVRNSLRSYLMTKRIFCPIHWNLQIDEENPLFAEERMLGASILTLPIDQRLEYRMLDFMLKEIKKFLKGDDRCGR